jgi:hypothetical protein
MSKCRCAVLVFLLFNPAAFGQNSQIRGVNFNNFTYRVGAPYCDYFGPSIHIRNGRFENDRGRFEISQVLYGDVTGKGEQAVVVASCAPARPADSGWANNLVYVYGMDDGRPALHSVFAWGEPWHFTGYAAGPKRQDGLILFDVDAVSVEGDVISFVRSAGRAHCCPSVRVVQTFRWSEGEFVLANERKTRWSAH